MMLLLLPCLQAAVDPDVRCSYDSPTATRGVVCHRERRVHKTPGAHSPLEQRVPCGGRPLCCLLLACAGGPCCYVRSSGRMLAAQTLCCCRARFGVVCGHTEPHGHLVVGVCKKKGCVCDGWHAQQAIEGLDSRQLLFVGCRSAGLGFAIYTTTWG